MAWDDSDDEVFMRYRQAELDDFGSGSDDGYGYEYDSDILSAKVFSRISYPTLASKNEKTTQT